MRHNSIHDKEATSILNLNFRYFKLEIYLDKQNGNGIRIKNQNLYKKCLFLSDSFGLGRGCVMRARLVVVWGKAIAITMIN